MSPPTHDDPEDAEFGHAFRSRWAYDLALVMWSLSEHGVVAYANLEVLSAEHFVAKADDAEAQRRSFAFGNASMSNPKVTREMVDEVADEMLENVRRGTE